MENASTLTAASDLRFGVLHFSYANSPRVEEVARTGHTSINLGDYMQTMAVRALYEKAGIRPEQVVEIDRDSMASYDGGRVIVVMNACFFKRCFPIPETIVPVFIGFEAKEPIIEEYASYFRRHAPIGCRDRDTVARFQKHGIDAFLTGCLTLIFDDRPKPPQKGKVIVPYGTGPGEFPVQALKAMPGDILAKVEFVSQREIIHECPMPAAAMRQSERYARHLLDYYREHASLVVTPLHHAATPCIASNIPVVICRKKDDSRFSYLKELVDIHLPPDFSGVDWRPAPIDLSNIRSRLIEVATGALDVAIRRETKLHDEPETKMPSFVVKSHPAEARFDDEAFGNWLQKHPGRPYSEFSAQKVASGLRKGTPHPTLGRNLTAGGEWWDAGRPVFEELLALHNTPEDAKVCEYGCGSLRVGAHFIRRQPARSYFGLDVTGDFIKHHQIDETLWNEKQPETGRIADQIGDAEAFGADLLFATHVAIHVHPEEKQAFFENIKKIISRPGGLIIFDALIAKEPVRFRNSGWGWPIGFYLAGMQPFKLIHMQYRRDREDVGQEFFFVWQRPQS